MVRNLFMAICLRWNKGENTLKGIRLSGEIKINGEGAFPSGDGAVPEDVDGLAGNGGGGVDDLDAGAGDALDHGLEEGVVGAAKDDGIGPLLKQWLK